MRGEKTEHRFVPELRAAGRSLVGHVAVFDQVADIGGFRERIAPGAFRQSLANSPDIVALVDHDPSQLLGRTKTGTLKLMEDERGLAFSLSMPDTQLGRDILSLADRGDLGGGSIGFRVPNGGEDWDGDLRTLRSIDLLEVSIVQSWPAYAGTQVAARAKAVEDLRRKYDVLRVRFV